MKQYTNKSMTLQIECVMQTSIHQIHKNMAKTKHISPYSKGDNTEKIEKYCITVAHVILGPVLIAAGPSQEAISVSRQDSRLKAAELKDHKSNEGSALLLLGSISPK
ncbi:unnamed protein product [Phaedon cochleariae]|uniref:Uncharacterized protein n=1 Tax=Phaedon cochleariae TaxID=80249 RepID=A0A9P0GU22_PHACE|nr:unnamed protein product [Phaedon cochleariae]